MKGIGKFAVRVLRGAVILAAVWWLGFLVGSGTLGRELKDASVWVDGVRQHNDRVYELRGKGWFVCTGNGDFFIDIDYFAEAGSDGVSVQVAPAYYEAGIDNQFPWSGAQEAFGRLFWFGPKWGPGYGLGADLRWQPRAVLMDTLKYGSGWAYVVGFRGLDGKWIVVRNLSRNGEW
jgi:hypothetical protein